MRAESVLTLLTVVASALAVGCAPARDPSSASTSAPTAAVPNVVPATSLPPGRAQVIVNGHDTGDGTPVSCATDDGLTTISIGTSSLGVTVVVTDDDMPSVRSVTIGSRGGISIGYADGAGGEAPTGYRNGATLTVSGSGSGTDSSNPAHVIDTSYQIAVACP